MENDDLFKFPTYFTAPENSGKNIAQKIFLGYSGDITSYIAKALTGCSVHENSGIPLELFNMEKILKSKLVFMKKTPITTVETNVHLAEGLIEDHINNMHHAEKTFSKSGQALDDILWKNFESLNWCCEHSPVEGTVRIGFLTADDRAVKHVSVPVVTNFGVVCTKEKERNYRITWSYSLS